MTDELHIPMIELYCPTCMTEYLVSEKLYLHGKYDELAHKACGSVGMPKKEFIKLNEDRRRQERKEEQEFIGRLQKKDRLLKDGYSKEYAKAMSGI